MKKKEASQVTPFEQRVYDAISRVPRGKVPAITRDETFAPILYIFEVADLEEAMAIHNDVDQGLSSSPGASCSIATLRSSSRRFFRPASGSAAG